MSTPKPGHKDPISEPAERLSVQSQRDASESDVRAPAVPAHERAHKQPATNFSLPRSPLLGREHEIAAIQRLLLQEHVGLLTLTGPGGIGKTRLAMQAAATLLDQFVDGVYFVSLAPIREATQVIGAIAQTLGVREVGGQPLLEALQHYLRQRQMLLVLDNFEQVLAAAPLLSPLLAECNRLKILVTSRATLHLYGEQEFPVPSLALPNPKQLNAKEAELEPTLTQIASVALFVQRAMAGMPNFILDATNATAVGEICISLDGLPLAIELAAAKTKIFPPSALLARLRQRLTVLTGGAHDLPLRQRTLRTEIAWSYDLLSADEQTIFRRVAFFVGGFSLDAAQAVSSATTDLVAHLLEGVAALVDQNLLRQEQGGDGEPRFWMLETIREYALEQLSTSGEAETIRRRHAEFYMTLAEAVEPKLLGPNREAGLAQLEMEIDNIRAALTWSLTELGNAEMGARLAVALPWFAHFSNHIGEARRWLAQAVQCTNELTATHAKALWGAALLAVPQADFPQARAQSEKSITLWRKLDDPVGLAAALCMLGYTALFQGDFLTAADSLAESISLFRAAGKQWELALSLHNLGIAATVLKDRTRGLTLFEECLSISRELHDVWGVSNALSGLGFISAQRGDYTTARSQLEEALGLWQGTEDKWTKTETLSLLGEVILRQGDVTAATAVFGECLALSHEIGDTAHSALVLRHLGSVAHRRGQNARAVQLFAAATSGNPAEGSVFKTLLDPAEQEREVAALRLSLSVEAFAMNWAKGEAMTLVQAMEGALATAEASEPGSTRAEPNAVEPPPADTVALAGLTARQVEVLHLLVQGLTYAQIAEKLVVSRRTVNFHVTLIYSKLGVTSRAAATRFAIDHHLT